MPQVWSLGVKEVWRVDHPLDRVVHTLGWPFRLGGKWKELGGSFIYPMGEDMLTIGLVCGLDTLDASLSVHDLAAAVQDAPADPADAGGRRADRLGREDDPRGRIPSIPHRLSVPGAIVTGDSAGFVNVPKLKGIHYAMRSGMLAAETIYEALKGGADLNAAGALDRLRRSGCAEPHLERPAEGAQHAPGARQGHVRRGALVGG